MLTMPKLTRVELSHLKVTAQQGIHFHKLDPMIREEFAESVIAGPDSIASTLERAIRAEKTALADWDMQEWGEQKPICIVWFPRLATDLEAAAERATEWERAESERERCPTVRSVQAKIKKRYKALETLGATFLRH